MHLARLIVIIGNSRSNRRTYTCLEKKPLQIKENLQCLSGESDSFVIMSSGVHFPGNEVIPFFFVDE